MSWLAGDWIATKKRFETIREKNDVEMQVTTLQRLTAHQLRNRVFFVPDLPIATVEPIEARRIRREAPPSLRVPLHEPSSKLSQSSGELAREPQPAKDV